MQQEVPRQDVPQRVAFGSAAPSPPRSWTALSYTVLICLDHVSYDGVLGSGRPTD